MCAQPLLHELMGMPKYLLDEHVEIIAEGQEQAWRPNYLDETVERFYQNDEHITGAVLWLHPLLDRAGLQVFSDHLEPPQEVDELFELDKVAPEVRVHLILEGRMRLVVCSKEGPPIEIGQCRPGQWLGMPSALREFDQDDHTRRWERPAPITVKAIPLGKVRTQSILLSELVAGMRNSSTLLQYVRQHVSIRFARRSLMLDRIRHNTILRLLPPADQEYLLQLGAVRRARISSNPNEPSVRYMSAGKPSRRVALLLDGKCTATLPGTPDRYAGQFDAPNIVGHEALVMPKEMEQLDSNCTIVEADRATDIYVDPGSEVLEFFWYAFRWALDDRISVWRRITQKFVHLRHAGRIPEIISIQASRPRLGLSVLATGLATSLADMIHDKVCIVDLQGQQRFEEYYQQLGFGFEERKEPIQLATRAERAQGRGAVYVQYRRLKPPTEVKSRIHWPSRVEVVWPADDPLMAESVGTVENLVELLYARNDLRYILVCMRQTAQGADSVTTQLANVLNSRSATVLYVTDETEAGYQFNVVPPRRLIWVERMTDGYKKREHKRMVHAMNEARYGQYASLLPEPKRDKLIAALGGFPDEHANTDFIFRRQIVRVPDDAHSVGLFDKYGPYAAVGPGAPNMPLKRAVARLGRVVTRQTVGLALGGGGAWGYSHLALIQNLEEQGVPIDYITGTSFGSIVGGLYVAGGMTALDRLIEENSLNANAPTSIFVAPFTSPLMRTVMFAVISASSIEWFVNSQLKRMGINRGEPLGLGMTEIPFYPISSNLTTHSERTEEHGNVGYGVRLSGTMPPVAPAFRLNGQLLVDGAFIANVPSRYLRAIGADFIIAANAVPPAPAESKNDDAITRVVDFMMTRMNDALAANQLLTWKAGEDQANLHADYICDLQPKNANVFDMWKGRAIMEQIRQRHFSGPKATAIRDAYLRFCNAPQSRREDEQELDGGDGAITAVRMRPRP